MSECLERPIVAIDGPAGAGKSTVARMLASRLGYVYIDTGAMYRGVALAAQRRGVSWDTGEELAELVRALRLQFEPGEERPRLLVDGEDVSAEIRSAEISCGASKVSCHPGVRTALVEQQRRMGACGGVVMEGRDIGTVVFPDARVKIFLTATPKERARRRAAELGIPLGTDAYEQVLAEVVDRDRRDMERACSPLRKASDAVEVVTDGMELAAVVDRLEQLVRAREQE